MTDQLLNEDQFHQDRVRTPSGLRSTKTGHRITENGVQPRQSRDIVLKDRRPGYVYTELRDRRAARKAGRKQNGT
jgi:hypothetical protein